MLSKILEKSDTYIDRFFEVVASEISNSNWKNEALV